MVRIKKKQTATRKRKYPINETNQTNSPKRENRSSRIVTKNFEIFVTDFLADPCGLPVELRDYVLVDGSTSLNETSGIHLSSDGDEMNEKRTLFFRFVSIQ